MKNLFGSAKDSDASFGDACIVKRLSADLQEKIDRENERIFREVEEKIDSEMSAHKAQEQRKRLGRYRYLLYVLAVVTLIYYLAPDVSMTATLRANAAFFWTSLMILAGAVGVLIWDLVRLFRKNPVEQAAPDEEESQTEEDTDDAIMQELIEQAREELSVPQNAVEVNVLTCTYREKKGEWKPSLLLGYFPLSVWCYADEENLYLATDCVVYALPHAAFVKDEKVCGKLTMAFWNKSIPYDEAPYDAYGITKTGMDNVRLSEYHSLQWRMDGEDFEVMIPSYDVKAVTDLIAIAH